MNEPIIIMIGAKVEKYLPCVGIENYKKSKQSNWCFHAEAKTPLPT
jgi:hypothetical protein